MACESTSESAKHVLKVYLVRLSAFARQGTLFNTCRSSMRRCPILRSGRRTSGRRACCCAAASLMKVVIYCAGSCTSLAADPDLAIITRRQSQFCARQHYSHVSMPENPCIADEGQSLVRPAEDKLPGHALALSLQRLWQVIREQKDLNLPAHKVISCLPCGCTCRLCMD